MQSMAIESDMESKQKMILGLFWTTRKTIRTEGCAPIRIKKITTSTSEFEPEGRKLLKLSDEIMDDILENMEKGNKVKFDLSMGGEKLEAVISDDFFSINATKTPDLEDDIISKMEHEMQRKTPDFCKTFIPRVFPQKK